MSIPLRRTTGTPTRGPQAALATVLAVLFLTFLDTTIVSVTLGNLETDVSAGVIPLQWVINAYALVFASLMLVGGSLGDRFGRRRVMAIGVAIFCVGSLVCALASTVWVVIAGRAVMGVGAAASEPGTLSVIRQLYPHAGRRARALGSWSAVSGLALALGPVVGGLLVGAGGWRAVFWFNLAFGVVLLAAVRVFVPESSDPAPGRLDWLGFAVATAGIGCVVFAAISGEYVGYGTGWIVALFVIGGLCLAAFFPLERRIRFPMLNPDHLRAPIVRAALFAAFAVYFAVFAIFFLTALYLDIAEQYSGPQLAAVFAPMAVAIVIGSLAAGRWIAGHRTRPPMVIGCALAAAGMFFARAELARTAGLSSGPLALSLAVAGLGFGLTVVPLTSAVLSQVPARHSGVAASMTNTARQLGSVFGVAVLGAIVNAHLTSAVTEFVARLPFPESFRQSVVRLLETGGGGAGAVDLTSIPAPFVTAFRTGLQVGLLVAIALMIAAAAVTWAVPEPSPDQSVDQVTATGATAAGSAPESTSSTGPA